MQMYIRDFLLRLTSIITFQNVHMYLSKYITNLFCQTKILKYFYKDYLHK